MSGPARPTTTALVNPATGEQLELDAPSDVLAGAVAEFKRRETQYAAWRRQAEAELVRRLAVRNRRRATVGEWELEIEATGRARVWDTDELEQTLVELEAAGTIRAGEVAGLLTPQPPKVDGKAAAHLLTRVAGPARVALERCFRWEQKGKPRLAVTRSTQLLPPDRALNARSEAQEATG